MVPWLRTDMKYTHDIYVRYGNMPTNGFSQYYYSSESVLKALSKKSFDKPTLMVVSEADSVVDVPQVLALFTTRFTHPDSRLIWYGAPPETDDARILVRTAYLPEWRISNFSHMGMVFSPDNPLTVSTASFACVGTVNPMRIISCARRGSRVVFRLGL